MSCVLPGGSEEIHVRVLALSSIPLSLFLHMGHSGILVKTMIRGCWSSQFLAAFLFPSVEERYANMERGRWTLRDSPYSKLGERERERERDRQWLAMFV